MTKQGTRLAGSVGRNGLIRLRRAKPAVGRGSCLTRLSPGIADLTGQLYDDPDGTHLADENARLRNLILTLNKNLQQTQLESTRLRLSLDGARANVKRERERNVTRLFAGQSDHS